MTGRMIRACGADDVAGNRLAFRKRRFEMIAALVIGLAGQLELDGIFT
jgi:hypothetical protein